MQLYLARANYSAWKSVVLKEEKCSNVPAQTFYFGAGNMLFNLSTAKAVGEVQIGGSSTGNRIDLLESAPIETKTGWTFHDEL